MKQKIRILLIDYSFFICVILAVACISWFSNELCDNFEEQRKLEKQIEEHQPDTPNYYKRIKESSIIMNKE